MNKLFFFFQGGNFHQDDDAQKYRGLMSSLSFSAKVQPYIANLDFFVVLSRFQHLLSYFSPMVSFKAKAHRKFSSFLYCYEYFMTFFSFLFLVTPVSLPDSCPRWQLKVASLMKELEVTNSSPILVLQNQQVFRISSPLLLSPLLVQLKITFFVRMDNIYKGNFLRETLFSNICNVSEL